MQKISKIIFEWKMCFNFLSKRVSKLPHYNKHSASWYRKRKAVWCKALAIVIRLQWYINIQARFSKNPQKLRDKLFIAEEQTKKDGHVESNSSILEFWKPIKNATRTSRFIDWHVQNATVPCRSQDLLPFLYLIYPSLPHFYTNYYTILPHLILPYISSFTSQTCRS